MSLKYKQLRSQTIQNPLLPGAKVKVTRIKALIDIPYHGVKAGDIGGFIGQDVKLSHSDTCWIAGDAIVLGSVYVSDHAIVKDNVVIHGGSIVKAEEGDGSTCGLSINDRSTVSGHAILDYFSAPTDPGQAGYIGGTSTITDNAALYNVRCVSGNTGIERNAKLYNRAEVIGSVVITDDVVVQEHVLIRGRLEMSGNSVIGHHSKISGASKIAENVSVPAHTVIVDGKCIKNDSVVEEVKIPLVEYTGETPVITDTPNSAKSVAPSTDGLTRDELRKNVHLEKYRKVTELIAEYSSDIVKLIKFPVMTDMTDPLTSDMVFAVKNVEMEEALGCGEEFYTAVIDLERKYLIAESNARKIAASRLTAEERKKTEQAYDLFAMACNGVSSEHEKRTAFKQGFRKLEGVVAVSDAAVHAMKVKIGIPELEM